VVQQRAVSPEVIYQTLAADTVFMELVGSTTFVSGGVTLDAMSIVTPGAELPKISAHEGLEVVIHDVADLSRREYITDEVDITTTWKVFLLAWPNANGKTMNDAARRIMYRFSKATTIETNPVPSGLGAIAQVLVLIPSDSVIIPIPE
jgi:hypothetical protein